MPGNNSEIVRRCFERRSEYWKEVPNNCFLFHFKWMPFLKNLRFEQLSYTQKQVVNHFEFHHEITTKDLLLKNIMSYAELNKMNVFDNVPLTFVMDMDSQTYVSDFAKFASCYETITKLIESNYEQSPRQYLKLINQKLQQLSLSKERIAITHCRPKIPKTHFAGKNIWILKPTGFNRGRGIAPFNSMERLKSLLKHYAEGGSDTTTCNFLYDNSKST